MTYAMAQQLGLLTTDEVRDIEGRPPLPPGEKPETEEASDGA